MSAPRFPEVTVKLSDEDGNAMAIVGRVVGAMRRAGVARVELDDFRVEALSGDYDHVLQTCMRWVEVE